MDGTGIKILILITLTKRGMEKKPKAIKAFEATLIYFSDGSWKVEKKGYKEKDKFWWKTYGMTPPQVIPVLIKPL